MIAVEGPMPVAQFMALGLAHPLHGYYHTRDPFGPRGDFTTAPEISQMFGELIGLWAATVWQAMGMPDPVRLVELGPGRGTLIADAVRAIKVVPTFRAAVRVDLVEISAILRQRQAAALAAGDVPVAWYAALTDVPDAPSIVIANEFFDALPVHQAVRAADGWHERMVGLSADGALALALHPEPIAGFDALLPGDLVRAPLGAIYEWRSDQLGLELSQRSVRHNGAALIIDYGHSEGGVGETLQAVGGHQFADVLDRPGERDLTAHVDFAALGRVARKTGAQVFGPVPQGAFLAELGIHERAARLKTASPAHGGEIDSALARLAGKGAGRMGELFKALAVAAPQLQALPGFGSLGRSGERTADRGRTEKS